MTHSHGRIASGQRLYRLAPYSRGNKFSIFEAVSFKKILASAYMPGSVNKNSFPCFIKLCTLYKIKSADCIVMDNVSFHKMPKIQELINSKIAELLFYPPYSPELSPTELNVE
ncbi:MAG: transposase [Francisellaceae bacterium]|nr:transposase [Francisellaceae bacterium]